LAANFDIPTSVDQLCVCPGPKDAIFKAAMAMTNGRAHRRRFVCFAPIYESFISIPLLVGGEDPIVLPTDPKTFLPDPAQLRATLEAHDDICCVIVNSPNNPTGAIYPAALLRQLAAVIGDFPEVWALSDEGPRARPRPVEDGPCTPRTRAHAPHPCTRARVTAPLQLTLARSMSACWPAALPV
jgi:aspartate/methionine/tyrosine aminotransferase